MLSFRIPDQTILLVSNLAVARVIVGAIAHGLLVALHYEIFMLIGLMLPVNEPQTTCLSYPGITNTYS